MQEHDLRLGRVHIDVDVLEWHAHVEERPEVGRLCVQAGVDGLDAGLERRAVHGAAVDEQQELRLLAAGVLIGDEAFDGERGLLARGVGGLAVAAAPAETVGEVDEVVFDGGAKDAADDVAAGVVGERLDVWLVDAGALEADADAWMAPRRLVVRGSSPVLCGGCVWRPGRQLEMLERKGN